MVSSSILLIATMTCLMPSVLADLAVLGNAGFEATTGRVDDEVPRHPPAMCR
jgi:hypothetical protein